MKFRRRKSFERRSLARKLFGVPGAFMYQGGGLSGNYEDLTTYTVVDSEGNLQNNPNQLIITNMHVEHTEAYIYKDFGAGYFSKDVVINFDFCVTDDSGQDTSDMFGLIALCNTLGCRDDNDAGPFVNWAGKQDGTIQIYVGDDSWSTSYMRFNAVPNVTVFYCTLERISAVAPNDCQVLLSVYSDAARTSLMPQYNGNPSIRYGEDDVPSATGLTEFQYLEVGLSERLSYDDTALGSYNIENLEIISH